MSFDFSALITDRTQADVNRVGQISAKIKTGTASASELAEFNGAAMKGAYNYTDLNRVGSAAQYVADCFNRLGYAVCVEPKTDWTELDAPILSNMEQYLSVLAVLRNVVSVMKSTPNVPLDMERLTYVEANNIEKILVDIDFLLTNAAKAWCYSGDVFSGEV